MQPGEQREAKAGEEVEHILVLNHHRDPLEDLVRSLRLNQSNIRLIVKEADSLAATQRLLAETSPAVVILNPLILKSGGVEFELIELLQRDERPVPVILLVESAEALAEARHLDVPFLDFLMRPFSAEECAHRVELALLTRHKFMALQARARDLEGQVSVDFKTQLLSPRYFEQLLQIEFKRSQRHRTPLSILLIDIDNFKEINDTTEYAFGDEVLQGVAALLKHNIRETDFAARFGGDEFVLLLPHTTPAEAVQTAIRIRKKISAHAVRTPHYTTCVTVSVGIDTYDGRADATSEELRRRANKALQEAKRRGKNQVWLYAPEASGTATRPAEQADSAESATDH